MEKINIVILTENNFLRGPIFEMALKKVLNEKKLFNYEVISLSYKNPPLFTKFNNEVLNEVFELRGYTNFDKLPMSFDDAINNSKVDISKDIFVSLEFVGPNLFKKYEVFFEKYVGLKNKSFLFCIFDYSSFKWTNLLEKSPIDTLIEKNKDDRRRKFFVKKLKKLKDTGKKPFFFLWIGKKKFYSRVYEAYSEYLDNSLKASEDFIFNMIKMGKIKYEE